MYWSLLKQNHLLFPHKPAITFLCMLFVYHRIPINVRHYLKDFHRLLQNYWWSDMKNKVFEL